MIVMVCGWLPDASNVTQKRNVVTGGCEGPPGPPFVEDAAEHEMFPSELTALLHTVRGVDVQFQLSTFRLHFAYNRLSTVNPFMHVMLADDGMVQR